jgi:hypothetical protein
VIGDKGEDGTRPDWRPPVSDEVIARALELQKQANNKAYEEFDRRWGDAPKDGCGGAHGYACGGCYDCVLAQAAQHWPPLSDYFAQAEMEVSS